MLIVAHGSAGPCSPSPSFDLSGKQQTLLSQGDHQALHAALGEETRPTPALLEAWQLHQEQVVRS